ELGIGRPSTYAATLSTLRDREYVRIEKKRLVPEDKGMLVTAFLESFFKRYVEFDFTANLEENLDRVSNAEIDWKALLRQFWEEFTASIGETKDLRVGDVLEALNGILGDYIFPPKADGSDPRVCPNCGNGTLSLKLGKFGAFVGCSNYPECRYTRPLSIPAAEGEASAEGGQGTPGVRVLGTDPVTQLEVTLRDGRFGPYIQLGEGEKPKRSSLPKGMTPASVTLEKALALLSLPREVAKHPESGEPILVGIGRYGPYVQHGRTYANIDKGDDVLELGANRAIDLIVAKESGGGRRGGAAATPGRALGEHPDGGTLEVKAGRYGPYVAWGKIFATLPKSQSPDALTLEQAIELVNAKAATKGGAKGKAKAAGTAKAKAPAKKATAKKAPAKKAPAKKASEAEAVEKKAPKAARG
ncbi:MAG: topoisomerase C-terminal repeat-containing protein, partial [Bosea sp. (in: a-proteobacteria)]|nr:topoisomerase C-terminal repeat-containing protein [Bosea sp. (in: a-proteobacteria)]